MPNINEALKRLETNLRDIESAKEQVENTVNASSRLQKIVEGYTTSVQSLLANVEEWKKSLEKAQHDKSLENNNTIKQLRDSCEEVVKNFDKGARASSTTFGRETQGAIDKLADENNRLADLTQKLTLLERQYEQATKSVLDIKEVLDGISNDLNASQQSQDEILNDIKDQTHQLNQNISTSIDQKISTLATDIKAHIDKSLENQTTTLTSSINKALTQIAKKEKTNTWIIIAVLIIAFILIILIK